MLDLVLQFSEKLECGVCENVIVWVHDPTKLAVNVGVTDPDDLKYLISAHIKGIICLNSASWSYTFEYDEALLVDPETPLIECDIKRVCCESCFIQWWKENPAPPGPPADALVTPYYANTCDDEICGTEEFEVYSIPIPATMFTEPGQNIKYILNGFVTGACSVFIRLEGELIDEIVFAGESNFRIKGEITREGEGVDWTCFHYAEELLIRQEENPVEVSFRTGHRSITTPLSTYTLTVTVVPDGGEVCTDEMSMLIDYYEAPTIHEEEAVVTNLTLTVDFAQELDCGMCDDVLIWIYDPTLLLVNVGVTNPDLLKYLVEAKIGKVTCLKTKEYRYVLEYDSSILADEDKPLQECGVKKVCCESCFIQWWREHAANVCVASSDSIAFDVDEDGCVTGDVLISADADNALSLHADGLYASASEGGSGWLLTGNAGTVDGTNFLGTTDAISFDIRVNNLRSYRIQIGSTSDNPNIIGGCSLNSIGASGCEGNVIAGGGFPFGTLPNSIVLGQQCFIGSGTANQLVNDAFCSSVVGGNDNIVDRAAQSVIAGGESNRITAISLGNDAYATFIGGGISNIITGVGGDADFSAIVAGTDNGITNSVRSFIAAGDHHSISGSANSAIGGGAGNVITDSPYAAITSGYQGIIENGNFSVVHGGSGNEIHTAQYSAICGGYHGNIAGDFSTLAGGGQLKIGLNSFGFQGAGPGSGIARDVSAFSNIAIFDDVDLWVGNTNSAAGKLKLFEPNAAIDFVGAHYTSHEAQAQAANIEYVWPAAAGVAGNSLKIQSVVGPVVTLEWA